MAFVLNSVIKIGDYAFRGGVNDFKIKKGVGIIVDTATLKIPGLGRVVSVKSIIGDALNLVGIGPVTTAKQLPNSSIETAKLFKEGDPVAIDLGYNGDLRNEFRGFVRRVNLTTPITIEMEGYAWQLRNQNILASWRQCTIKDVLTRIIQGTDIVLSSDIPVINLGSFHIANRSGLEVLDYLKSHFRLSIYFADNVLYAGLEMGRTTAAGAGQAGTLAEVKYNIGYNIITNQPDLKKRLGSDNKVRVRIETKVKGGKYELYETGDPGGSLFKIKMAFIRDAAFLKKIAEGVLKREKYDGFEGSLTTFLQPFCQPGWKATIQDKKFEGARAGTYFIPFVETTFGVKGARRKVSISYRLDNPTAQQLQLNNNL